MDKSTSVGRDRSSRKRSSKRSTPKTLPPWENQEDKSLRVAFRASGGLGTDVYRGRAGVHGAGFSHWLHGKAEYSKMAPDKRALVRSAVKDFLLERGGLPDDVFHPDDSSEPSDESNNDNGRGAVKRGRTVEEPTHVVVNEELFNAELAEVMFGVRPHYNTPTGLRETKPRRPTRRSRGKREIVPRAPSRRKQRERGAVPTCRHKGCGETGLTSKSSVETHEQSVARHDCPDDCEMCEQLFADGIWVAEEERMCFHCKEEKTSDEFSAFCWMQEQKKRICKGCCKELGGGPRIPRDFQRLAISSDFIIPEGSTRTRRATRKIMEDHGDLLRKKRRKRASESEREDNAKRPRTERGRSTRSSSRKNNTANASPSQEEEDDGEEEGGAEEPGEFEEGEDEDEDEGGGDDDKNGNKPSVVLRKGEWNSEEHEAFLNGLAKLGEGAWAAISKQFVPTRTSVQVCSHAHNYNRNAKRMENKASAMVGREEGTSEGYSSASPPPPPPRPAEPRPLVRRSRSGPTYLSTIMGAPRTKKKEASDDGSSSSDLFGRGKT